MNFAITWLFDKLGYMPKIDLEIGKVNLEARWPFPAPVEKPKKPTVKKTVAKKKPAVKKAKPKAK